MEKKPVQRVAISRKKIGGEAPIVVSRVTDKCLYSGLFGTLDSARMKAATEKILNLLETTGLELIIIDLGNVDVLDSAVATHLVKLADTVSLGGVQVLFCGIGITIAQTMASVGTGLARYRISRDLRSSLKEALIRQGLALVPFDKLTKEAQAELQQQQQQQQQ